MTLRLVVSNPRPPPENPAVVHRQPFSVGIELTAIGLAWPPASEAFDAHALDALRVAADAAVAVVRYGSVVPLEVWEAWEIAMAKARAIVALRNPGLWPGLPSDGGVDLTLPTIWGIDRLYLVLPALGLARITHDRVAIASLGALQACQAALAEARLSGRPATLAPAVGKQMDKLARLLCRHGGSALILRAGAIRQAVAHPGAVREIGDGAA